MKSCPACNKKVVDEKADGWGASILRIFYLRRFRCLGCGRSSYGMAGREADNPPVKPREPRPQTPRDDGQIREVVERLRVAEAELKSKYEETDRLRSRRRIDFADSFRLDPTPPADDYGEEETDDGTEESRRRSTVSRLRARRQA